MKKRAEKHLGQQDKLIMQKNESSKNGANNRNPKVPKIRLGLIGNDSGSDNFKQNQHPKVLMDRDIEPGLNIAEELKGLPGGERFVDNNDNQGNSIVSKITRSLGSLKTLSGAADLLNDGNRNFNLFSHHQLIKEDKGLIFTYDALKEGLLELYLSVKIRSDDEIDNYNEELFKEEKRQLMEVDGFALIDYIKSSIEVLMNMKVEE